MPHSVHVPSVIIFERVSELAALQLPQLDAMCDRLACECCHFWPMVRDSYQFVAGNRSKCRRKSLRKRLANFTLHSLACMCVCVEKLVLPQRMRSGAHSLIIMLYEIDTANIDDPNALCVTSGANSQLKLEIAGEKVRTYRIA